MLLKLVNTTYRTHISKYELTITIRPEANAMYTIIMTGPDFADYYHFTLYHHKPDIEYPNSYKYARFDYILRSIYNTFKIDPYNFDLT